MDEKQKELEMYQTKSLIDNKGSDEECRTYFNRDLNAVN